MARPPEVRKVFNHLNASRREVIKAFDRVQHMYETTPPRLGHVAEMRRRLEAVRKAADEAVKTFTPPEPPKENQ